MRLLLALTRWWADLQPVDRVSADWLKQEQRMSARNQFEGPCIEWPINKLADANPWWNTRKMKKVA